jgi:hypothetical protein
VGLDQVRQARAAAQAHLERFVAKVLAADELDPSPRATSGEVRDLFERR